MKREVRRRVSFLVFYYSFIRKLIKALFLTCSYMMNVVHILLWAIGSSICGKNENTLSLVVLDSRLLHKKNALMSRNFCEKWKKTQCGKNRNLLSLFSDKNFVKVTFLLKKLLNSWFDEIFLMRVHIVVISKFSPTTF